MSTIVDTQIEVARRGSGDKGVYLSLCVSILLHLAILSLFLSGSMDSPGTPHVTEIIVVSLESGILDVEPVSDSPDFHEPASVQEQPSTPVKETLPVPEPFPEEEGEETHLESPPVPDVTPEEIPIPEEAAGNIPTAFTLSEQYVRTRTRTPVQDRDPTGPPTETMLAYAGGGLAPGILSSGIPKGEGDPFIPAVTVSIPEPSYPQVCRRRGQEGTVVLSVDIGIDGRPGKISIVETSGFSRLDHAAEEALRMAVFRPARHGAAAMESIKRVAFTFRLEDEDN